MVASGEGGQVLKAAFNKTKESILRWEQSEPNGGDQNVLNQRVYTTGLDAAGDLYLRIDTRILDFGSSDDSNDDVISIELISEDGSWFVVPKLSCIFVKEHFQVSSSEVKSALNEVYVSRQSNEWIDEQELSYYESEIFGESVMIVEIRFSEEKKKEFLAITENVLDSTRVETATKRGIADLGGVRYFINKRFGVIQGFELVSSSGDAISTSVNKDIVVLDSVEARFFEVPSGYRSVKTSSEADFLLKLNAELKKLKNEND